MKQIPVDHDRGNQYRQRDATDMKFTRTEAAKQAGLSERQKVTALRVASVPVAEFENAVESDGPRRDYFPAAFLNRRKPLLAYAPRWKIQDYSYNHESNNHVQPCR